MISVVIVNHNAGALLGQCVTAATRAADSHEVAVQIIIVDNASNDDSLAFVDRYGDSRLQVLRNERNAGLSSAINQALPLCDGDFVLLLNPDCLLTPDTLAGLLTVVTECPDTGVAGCLMFNLDGSEQRGDRRAEPTPLRALARSVNVPKHAPASGAWRNYDQHTLELPDQPIVVDAVSGSCLLVDKALFVEIGGMDTGFFLHFEDLDLCKRVRDAGRKVRFTPHVCAFHVQGLSSRSRPYWVEWRKHQSMWRYFFIHHRPRIRGYTLPGAVSGPLYATLIAARWALIAAQTAVRLLRAPSRSAADDTQRPVTQVMSLIAASSDAPDNRALGERLMIMGARSLVGRYIIGELDLTKWQPMGLSSEPRHVVGFENASVWHREFAVKAPPALLGRVGAVIHLAPIWTLANYVPRFAQLGVTKIIALSSSSIDGKKTSAAAADQRLVGLLVKGEREARAACERSGIKLIMFRPTLIYDACNDANIARIRWWIETFGILPLLGHAEGLRQPIYAGDVAKACVAALESTKATDSDWYSIAGGETLTYDQMVRAAFVGSGKPVRILRVPRRLLRFAIQVARLIPAFRHLSADMADRMSQDLNVDDERARRQFNLEPVEFTPTLQALIAHSTARKP